MAPRKFKVTYMAHIIFGGDHVCSPQSLVSIDMCFYPEHDGKEALQGFTQRDDGIIPGSGWRTDQKMV